MLDAHPRQILRQRLAPAGFACLGGDGHRLLSGLLLGEDCGIRLRLVEQPQLIGGAPLAGGTEALGQQQVELLAQPSNLGLVLPLSGRLGENELLECGHLIGQIGTAEGTSRHEGSLPESPLE